VPAPPGNRQLNRLDLCYDTSGTNVADPGCSPGSKFFHPGSRVKKSPDSGSTTKNLSIFNTHKNCYGAKLLEISSGMFSWIPDPEVKKTLDPGSGSALSDTLPDSADRVPISCALQL
jgi:hypothetical protein